MIPTDAIELVDDAALCFVATVNLDGSPNLSPKGSMKVLDDHTLVFGDIHSPTTLANIEQGSDVVVNVVHPIRRRGYRFAGSAMLTSDPELVGLVTRDLGLDYGIDRVVVIDVDRCAAVESPRATLHGANEAELTEIWLGHFTRRRREEHEQIAQRYLDAWEAHDIDAICAMHSDDTEFVSPTFGRYSNGVDQLRDALATVFTVWPDLTFEVHQLLVADDHFVSVATASGTQRVPLELDGDIVDPTPAPVRFDVVDVFELRNRKITSKRTVIDGVAYRAAARTQVSVEVAS